MQSVLMAVLIIGGSTLLANLGLILVRKHFDSSKFDSHHEVGGYMLSILGTLYAVVLGFIVVTVSSDSELAKSNVEKEVNSMMDIARFADGFSAKEKEKIKQACVDYAHSVVNDEWNDMVHGRFSMKTAKAMLNLWQSIKLISPVTPQEQCLYSAILTDYENMADAHRVRIVTARGRVSPILWMVLIIGAVILIGFTYIFRVEKLAAQTFMTSVVTITLSLNLFLVVVNSKPFSGDFKIQPTGFQLALKVLETPENKIVGVPVPPLY